MIYLQRLDPLKTSNTRVGLKSGPINSLHSIGRPKDGQARTSKDNALLGLRIRQALAKRTMSPAVGSLATMALLVLLLLVVLVLVPVLVLGMGIGMGMGMGEMAACIATLVVLCASTVSFYRLCLHPLSRIPGPRLAALTSAWYAYQVRNGRMLHLGTTLHHKYGPVVRVSPNEVWFNSKDAFRLIYSQQAPAIAPTLPAGEDGKLTPRQVQPVAMRSLISTVSRRACLSLWLPVQQQLMVRTRWPSGYGLAQAQAGLGLLSSVPGHAGSAGRTGYEALSSAASPYRPCLPHIQHQAIRGRRRCSARTSHFPLDVFSWFGSGPQRVDAHHCR